MVPRTVPAAISVAEMRALEENSEYLGVSKLLLMENAGREVAREIELNIKKRAPRAIVLAHIGNKAGDAFVTARHLAARGFLIEILMIANPDEIKTEEARTNWKIVGNMEQGIKIQVATQPDEIRKYLSKKPPDVIIDGLLGTGIKGVLREPLITAIREINRMRGHSLVVAIDVPSGLDPDRGTIHGDAVRAHMTVTHHAYKVGLLAKGSKRYTGRMILAEIGVPPEAELFVGPGDLRLAMKARSPFSHKGDSGRLLVIAGSKRYSGSAGLCGLAALRAGVDLVTIVAPESVSTVVRSYSPDLIVRSISGDQFGARALPTVKELLAISDAVAIGPGLGLAEETIASVLECLALCRKIKIPTVIDADAIKALRGKVNTIRGLKSVLTPHAGEFKTLTSKELPPETDNGWVKRSDLVRRWASEYGTTLLVKGHYQIISDGIRMKVNRTGNPGMTVGGTGDVLTGIVGAFLAWGNGSFESACAGAFLNGAVGDYVAAFKGYHLLASDLIEALPKVAQRFDPGA